MPRVVPEYKEEAKKKIIEEARRLFLTNGYRATKMTDIASSLGVTKGAIYLYFSSKEDLLVSMIQSSPEFKRAPIFKDLTAKEFRSIPSPAFLAKMLNVPQTVDRLGQELASEAAQNENLRKTLARFYGEEIGEITESLMRLQRGGVIREDVNPRHVALGLLSLRGGMKGFLSTGMPRADVETTWRIFTEGLLKEILVEG
ncbi:MAG: TetR/AcrR family transcriptional regulator [Candidatus Bathyarchaeota archaeon]|nr:TetR/AcrR family transcriptional regulator [Candidatus Bathyarchaeota archaeon]